MKIYSEKSKEIIISFAQDGNFRSTIPNIKIDGRDIAQICHAKLLGVYHFSGSDMEQTRG